MILPATRPQLLATLFILGFFFLLLWTYVTNVYQQHFFDHGPLVVAWQAARIIYIPYILWLQYAVGAYVLNRIQGSGFRIQGLEFFIASFLLGTSLWHIVLLGVGLAGLYHYPVMLLMAGGVMVASWRHLVHVIPAFARGSRASRDVPTSGPRPPHEVGVTIMALLVVCAGIAFIFLKGAYPGGGHDFFNHYFTYYKEVVASGSLGPHATWYQYYYSKGLGLYFLSMILLDPLAIHLVGTSFVVVAACIVFDFLKKPGESRLLPMFGVFLYLMCYIYTSGRGIFAANGGWGDLEKTHELTAVLMLGSVWLVHKLIATRDRHYAAVLFAVCIANVIITFAAGLLAGLFFALLLLWCAVRKDRLGLRAAFFAGASTALAMVAMLAINYVTTGLPQDQLIVVLWPIIDWQKVVSLGYTLELYAHRQTILSLSQNSLPISETLYKMLVEYYRLYMLWPLLAAGSILYLSRQRRVRLENSAVILLFLVSTYVLAIFFGGRSQFISFFRFSTFNYAPALILCLLLWRVASPHVIRRAVVSLLSVAGALVVWGAAINPPQEGKVTFPLWMHFKVGEWEKLVKAAYRLNSGEYSLYDALRDQKGRVGRMKWGGIHPSMRIIYSGLPAGTRVWSLYNHSYCLLPACNLQQYFSQVTSPRWYDIALGSVEEGQKIMQSEGLNFFFYSRNINTVVGSDTRDQLAAFYKGLAPEHIDKTFGILWTNGWDYLLTWKEESAAPLDADFMESWKAYYEGAILPRKFQFPVDKLAAIVKKSAEDPQVKHPTVPQW